MYIFLSPPVFAYPNDDGVIALENRDEFISPYDLRLIQGPEPTEHLDAAFIKFGSHAGWSMGLCPGVQLL